jgi:undecaprenyl-diphosphatase
MPTTALQMRKRIQNTRIRYFVIALIYAFTVFVILGRLVSGVHWLSDIVGGLLLSGALLMLYIRMVYGANERNR